MLVKKIPTQAVRQDRRADRGGEKQDQPTDELCENRARGKLQGSRQRGRCLFGPLLCCQVVDLRKNFFAFSDPFFAVIYLNCARIFFAFSDPFFAVKYIVVLPLPEHFLL